MTPPISQRHSPTSHLHHPPTYLSHFTSPFHLHHPPTYLSHFTSPFTHLHPFISPFTHPFISLSNLQPSTPFYSPTSHPPPHFIHQPPTLHHLSHDSLSHYLPTSQFTDLHHPLSHNTNLPPTTLYFTTPTSHPPPFISPFTNPSPSTVYLTIYQPPLYLTIH